MEPVYGCVDLGLKLGTAKSIGQPTELPGLVLMLCDIFCTCNILMHMLS